MRRRFVGVVVSDKMDKTRVVIAERMERHPLYKKEMRRNTNSMCMTKQCFQGGRRCSNRGIPPHVSAKTLQFGKVLGRKQLEEEVEEMIRPYTKLRVADKLV